MELEHSWQLQTDAGILSLTRAEVADAETVLTVIHEATMWLLSRGIRQWEPGAYPRRMVEVGIASGELFVLRRGLEIVGTVRLQWEDADVWGEQPPIAGYVHTLTIRRSVGGSGVGAAMMGWCDERAREAGRSLMRLDCAGGNVGLCAYYERLGYRRVGERRWGNWLAGLYEKELRA